MINLQAGQNTPLSSDILQISIKWDVAGLDQSDIDVSAFMLGTNDKVRSDADFIFYNQPTAAEGCLSLISQTDKQCYSVDLKKVPTDVMKIAFAIAINRDANFSAARELQFSIEGEALFNPQTHDMMQKALILGQLYRHNGAWKFRAVGAGFNDGLGPLATSFGVIIDEQEAPAACENTSKPTTRETNSESSGVNLEKIIAQQAPRLVNLAKPAAISLSKNNLTQIRARVALVLDCSGSMYNQFRSGNVQAVLERIAVLAVQFDDDAAFDLWAFANKFAKYDDVSLSNIDGYIEKLTAKEKKFGFSLSIVKGLGGGNNEPPVMQEVIDYYKDSDLPAYVLFITDGGIHQSKKIKSLMLDAANYPVFWQFLGLGGSSYGILKELDDLTGRVVDNADFFAVDDFKTVSDSDLYDRLLNEFPGWLKAAKAANIIK